MKFSLEFDTKGMTKEERAELRKQLEMNLATLKHESATVARAKHRPLSDSSTVKTFFGMPFDFESMSLNDLTSAKREARALLFAIMKAISLKKKQ